MRFGDVSASDLLRSSYEMLRAGYLPDAPRVAMQSGNSNDVKMSD
jgi:hypothetical protein